MLNTIIIFGAKYLYLFEVALFAGYFLGMPQRRKRSMVILSAVYLPVAYVVAKLTSVLYVDPRPFVAEHIVPLIPHAADNGFPSDHMLFAGAMASILYVYDKKIGMIAWGMALLVGASRVFAGVHHWIDIIGSITIAVGTLIIIRRYVLIRGIK